MAQDQVLPYYYILLPYSEEQAETSIHKSAILGDQKGIRVNWLIPYDTLLLVIQQPRFWGTRC